MSNAESPFVCRLEEVGSDDIMEVGGKNASLGEMLKHLNPLGINIPTGFVTTSTAFNNYIDANDLEEPIRSFLERYHRGELSVEEAGRAIRKRIINGIFPIRIAEDIRQAYADMCEEYGVENVDVAVRSSATAEDLPGASFAGLQETYLNVRGEEELLKACRRCYASLFTARAIVYREEKGFDHFKVALSVGVQKMVRADKACAGVAFTLDTESGFPDIVMINGTWGLGENVVQGIVNPDHYEVFKPLIGKEGVKPILEKTLGSKEQKMVYASDEDSRIQNVNTTAEERSSFVLSDREILQLADWSKKIEAYYERPMDIEWVKDDATDELYIVQARPETVHAGPERQDTFKYYELLEKSASVLLSGLSIGNSIVSGKVKKVVHVDDLESIREDDILVTQMTEPDWVPSMKRAAGIITDSGGRTCHAAIVSRELGIPAIVGTHNATNVFRDGQEITLSCSEGDVGRIYEGKLEFEVHEVNLRKLPELRTDIMINLAVPESAFRWWRLPVKGVGLARMEFIISQHIKVHPMALIHFDRVIEEHEREKIRKLSRNYDDKQEFFVDRLSRGIAKIAASQYPRPVILRTSDFKTNEYAGLIGGKAFEPEEENPMLGWRGACRYYGEGYREGFALECEAIKKARNEIGLTNLIVMIPFCRTVEEARKVLQELENNGLRRGEDGLQVYMMCEIPSNVILAGEFAKLFDGFSIGSNDLTQLVLGVDRDSAELSYLFREDNEAVKESIREVISKAHEANIPIGFCGQAPSDDPEYAAFLVEAGIDSISLNPDSVINVMNELGQAQKKQKVLDG